MVTLHKHKYIHNNVLSNNKSTVAYADITSTRFFDMLYSQISKEDRTPPDIQLFVGVTKVHPSDQYNKKTGRNAAEKHMEWVTFGLTALHRLPDRTLYFFTGEHSRGNLSLVAYVYEDSKNVRITHMSLNV